MITILGMHVPSAIAVAFLVGVIAGMVIRGKLK